MTFRADILAGKAVILVEVQDTLDAGLRAIRAKLRRFSFSISQLGGEALRFGGVGVIGTLFPLKEFVEFQDNLLFLQTKLQATDGEMVALEKTIRNLGKSTSFTSQQVAAAATELAKAGFSIKEVQSTLEPALDLARGGRVDLTTATAILANNLRTFGLEADKAAGLASKFITAARLGTLDIVDLNESLKESSGTFRLLNVPVERALALITQISLSSLKATKAGTSLNTALINLSRRKGLVEEIIGQPLAEADFESPVLLLTKLDAVLKNLPRTEQISILNDLTNIRGARAVTGILIQGLGRLASLQKEISGSIDEARVSALKLDSRLGGIFRRALSAFQELLISLGSTTEGPLTSFGETLRKVFNNLSQLGQENPRFIQTLFLIPPAALAAGTGLLTLGFALNKVASALTPIIFLNNLFFNSIIRIISANAKLAGTGLALLLGAGGSKKSSQATGLGASLRGIPLLINNIRRSVFSLNGFIIFIEFVLLFGDRIPPIKRAMDGLVLTLKNIGKNLGSLVTNIIPAFGNIGTAIKEIFTGDIKFGIDLLKTSIGELVDIIKTQLIVTWNDFLTNIKPATDAISNIVKGIQSTVDALVVSIGAIAGTQLKGAGFLLSPDGSLFKSITSAFEAPNIKGTLSAIIQVMGIVAEKIVQLIGFIVNILVDVKKVIGLLLRIIASFPGQAGEEARRELTTQSIIAGEPNAQKLATAGRNIALFNAATGGNDIRVQGLLKLINNIPKIGKDETDFKFFFDTEQVTENLRSSITRIVEELDNFSNSIAKSSLLRIFQQGQANRAAGEAVQTQQQLNARGALTNFTNLFRGATLPLSKLGFRAQRPEDFEQGRVGRDLEIAARRNALFSSPELNFNPFLDPAAQEPIKRKARAQALAELQAIEATPAFRTETRRKELSKATEFAFKDIAIPNVAETLASGLTTAVGTGLGILKGKITLGGLLAGEAGEKRAELNRAAVAAKAVVGSFDATRGQQLQAVSSVQDKQLTALEKIEENTDVLKDGEPLVFPG